MNQVTCLLSILKENDDFIITKSPNDDLISVVYEIPKEKQKEIRRNKKIMPCKQLNQVYCKPDILMFDIKIPCRCYSCSKYLAEMKILPPIAENTPYRNCT